uniref:Telomere repeat-binding factor 2 n=1 Tax=Rhizophora mucronata TaxID=61149 RepID=A0A2P2L3M4_RHIMU
MESTRILQNWRRVTIESLPNPRLIKNYQRLGAWLPLRQQQLLQKLLQRLKLQLQRLKRQQGRLRKQKLKQKQHKSLPKQQ